MRSRLPALVLLVAVAALPFAASATVFLSRTEAVETAFPNADRVDEHTYLLDEEQVRAIQERARAPLESKLVTVYTGYRGEDVVGYAVIDIHTVRTQPEAFMVVASPEGTVQTVRMLAFYEPREYLPPSRWFEQFNDEKLTPELHLQRKIHTIAGSTLSSRAVTGGVRRALAVFEVLLLEARAPLARPAPPAQGETGALGR